jgi:hypothetical protein
VFIRLLHSNSCTRPFRGLCPATNLCIRHNIVACRNVAIQRPRDKANIQQPFLSTGFANKHVCTATVGNSNEERCFLCGPCPDVISRQLVDSRRELKLALRSGTSAKILAMPGPTASNPLDVCGVVVPSYIRNALQKMNTESTQNCCHCTLVGSEKPHPAS